ncbi:hypothetical protein [Chengkuizengella axinellae]|uniref:Phage baseplate assembly protein V n=1 Tax=Chengkuizengella axinellae TaxID=3064388 RepID=A0ABT9J6P9_9BACL|nr:hypothetical protein [Chengkuizengella sp. 2205SS18-9]MDP5277138.1 hypothetical protein [Chengkuizengella sp. 2205SS18-9]
MLRVGIVSEVIESRKLIRATFPDLDHQVSSWLQFIKPPFKLDQYTQFEIPKVDDTVICLFLGNGEQGYWIGVIE